MFTRKNGMMQIFGFIKKIFTTLLAFGGSLATRCVSLNDQHV